MYTIFVNNERVRWSMHIFFLFLRTKTLSSGVSHSKSVYKTKAYWIIILFFFDVSRKGKSCIYVFIFIRGLWMRTNFKFTPAIQAAIPCAHWYGGVHRFTELRSVHPTGSMAILMFLLLKWLTTTGTMHFAQPVFQYQSKWNQIGVGIFFSFFFKYFYYYSFNFNE